MSEPMVIKPGDEVMYAIDHDPSVFAITVQEVVTIYGRTYVEGVDNTGGEHLVNIDRIIVPDRKELPDGPNKQFRREQDHT